MEIIKQSIFHIDWETSDIKYYEFTEDNADLEQYLGELLSKISLGENKREFEFTAGGSVVKDRIADILNGNDFLAETQTIATRLMQKESQSSAETRNLKHDIPKGFAIQILFKDDQDNLKLIITKSDDTAYLDNIDLKKHLGLPIEKKTYKTFLTEINADSSLGKVYVMDTTSYLAKYWWQDFLELAEKTTDNYNTKHSFDGIETVINGIRKKHPADHTILKNSMIGYFRTNEKFDMDDFLSKTIDNYDSEDSNFDKTALTSKIRLAQTTSGLDTQFKISPEEITNSKIKRVIHLSGKMDLVLKDSIDDLKNVITAVEEDGVKYIRIRTDVGYNQFSKA